VEYLQLLLSCLCIAVQGQRKVFLGTATFVFVEAHIDGA